MHHFARSMVPRPMRHLFPRTLKRVVVLGGGPSGLFCADRLRHHFEVTLVDTKDFFEFTPSILRAVVDPSHYAKITFDYRSVLEGELGVEFVQAQATKVEMLDNPSSAGRGLVTITDKDGEARSLHFDYCIVAVGVSNGVWKPRMPGDRPVDKSIGGSGLVTPAELCIEDRREALRQIRDGIYRARGAVIVGAGLVGVEMAAELVHFLPRLRITLVDGSMDVLPQLGEDARQYARQWLQQHNVALRLNKPFTPEFVAPDEVVLSCVGTRARAGNILAEKSCLRANGQIRVNRKMQVIFVPGVDEALDETTASNATIEEAPITPVEAGAFPFPRGRGPKDLEGGEGESAAPEEGMGMGPEEAANPVLDAAVEAVQNAKAGAASSGDLAAARPSPTKSPAARGGGGDGSAVERRRGLSPEELDDLELAEAMAATRPRSSNAASSAPAAPAASAQPQKKSSSASAFSAMSSAAAAAAAAVGDSLPTSSRSSPPPSSSGTIAKSTEQEKVAAVPGVEGAAATVSSRSPGHSGIGSSSGSCSSSSRIHGEAKDSRDESKTESTTGANLHLRETDFEVEDEQSKVPPGPPPGTVEAAIERDGSLVFRTLGQGRIYAIGDAVAVQGIPTAQMIYHGEEMAAIAVASIEACEGILSPMNVSQTVREMDFEQPFLCCTSLGPHDGMFSTQTELISTGALAALQKQTIEATKMNALKGDLLSSLVWYPVH
mmetsp:Transcript_15903/g.34843  ORF Transcript_15903/g.34843 Transcript_15903/m.34843 type:complete len:720 (+) Transcript_15903:39-2198(+)